MCVAFHFPRVYMNHVYLTNNLEGHEFVKLQNYTNAVTSCLTKSRINFHKFKCQGQELSRTYSHASD